MYLRIEVPMWLVVIILVVFALMSVHFGIAAAAIGAWLVARILFAGFVMGVGIALLVDLIQGHRDGRRRF